MTKTGYVAFDKTVDKTNQILKQIEEAYGWPQERRNQSYAALRTVLQTLRDRLTVEEIPQLGAQLPMLVKGIYYEGWDPTRTPMKMSAQEMLERVRREFLFDIPGSIDSLFKVVLSAVRKNISDGEWDDLEATLPQDVRRLLPDD